MHVKICGLTNVEDALAAVEAGADYVGFNFYSKSPRLITAERCTELVAAVRERGKGVRTVGIFVNHAPAEVAALMERCGLDLAQLHGDEGLEGLAGLRGRAFMALRDGDGQAVDYEALARFSPGEPAFLMDAYAPGAYGGTGVVGDWGRAAEVAARYPIFLAGGLTPENVGQAIETVRPWGVDVASGVERAPGVKDHLKIRAFVSNARRAVDDRRPTTDDR